MLTHILPLSVLISTFLVISRIINPQVPRQPDWGPGTRSPALNSSTCSDGIRVGFGRQRWINCSFRVLVAIHDNPSWARYTGGFLCIQRPRAPRHPIQTKTPERTFPRDDSLADSKKLLLPFNFLRELLVRRIETWLLDIVLLPLVFLCKNSQNSEDCDVLGTTLK